MGFETCTAESICLIKMLILNRSSGQNLNHLPVGQRGCISVAARCVTPSYFSPEDVFALAFHSIMLINQ